MFRTPSDERAWAKSGEPWPTSVDVDQTVGRSALRASEYIDPTGLPTDPASLRRALGKEGYGDDASGTLFAVVTLLDEPGISPALRSAIFTALADTPGVMTYGLLTDPLGRTGETVGVVVDGIRIVMSFDPATTSLLELQKTVVNPAQLVVPKEPGAVRWPTDTIMSTESFSVPVLVPDANTVPG